MGMYSAAQRKGKELGSGTEHKEAKDREGPGTEKGSAGVPTEPGHAGNVEMHAHLAEHHRSAEEHHDQLSKLHAQISDAHAAHADRHGVEAAWHEARC